MNKSFMEIKIEDIIKWCQDNNQVEWLKAEALKEVDYKVYPRKKITKEVKQKDGSMKTVHTTVADKSQEPKIEKRKVSFVQIKTDFCEKFLPELMKPKDKKPTMYELIANL